jgi:lactam utilization protein B
MMKDTILAALAALAGALLLAGCATDARQQDKAYADASYTPVGTYIPRKKSSGPSDNVVQVDKQALENDRMNGNATINLPTR